MMSTTHDRLSRSPAREDAQDAVMSSEVRKQRRYRPPIFR
jgi:hypothetical protein